MDHTVLPANNTMPACLGDTCLGWREADGVIAKVDAADRLAIDRTVLLPLLQDVGERECEVVLGGLEHEVLGVEVYQSVEKNAWRVSTEQSCLPQVFFRHTANDHSCTHNTIHQYFQFLFIQPVTPRYYHPTTMKTRSEFRNVSVMLPLAGMHTP